MGQRGGKRPGAGRKPGLRHLPTTLSPIKMAEIKLAQNLPALIDLALSLALAGDRALMVYLIDRVLGKSVQPIAIETQVAEIAAEYGVEPERVTSIVERLKARKVG